MKMYMLSVKVIVLLVYIFVFSVEAKSATNGGYTQGRIEHKFRFKYIDENQPIGTVVARIPNIVKLCPVSGNRPVIENKSQNSPFEMTADGTIKTTEVLDREVTKKHIFQVHRICPVTVTMYFLFVYVLDVNDNAPLFLSSSYQAYANVSSAVGTKIIQVHTYDPDAGDNGRVRYSICWQADPPLFSIHPKSGWISVAATLNADFRSRKVTVCAKDGGSPPLSGRARVQIHIRAI